MSTSNLGTKDVKKNTREDLLMHAEVLFSKNGFYGTSINDIAKEVKVSKQALLHHFSTKEKIYAAVLENAAEHLNEFVSEVTRKEPNAKEQLRSVFSDMAEASDKRLRVIILLLRELLDNPERAPSANKWFLRPFLDALTQIAVQATQKPEPQALALVYHLLGATQYFVVSQPTLQKLYSKDEYRQFKLAHCHLIEDSLSKDI